MAGRASGQPDHDQDCQDHDDCHTDDEKDRMEMINEVRNTASLAPVLIAGMRKKQAQTSRGPASGEKAILGANKLDS